MERADDRTVLPHGQADSLPHTSASAADCGSHWNCSIWILGLLGLFAWQAWLALGLFGPERPWETLLDDRPVISGSHPQHLYLGTLGARSLATCGTVNVYDPAFQAAYPKTPIFNGSRLAELMLF